MTAHLGFASQSAANTRSAAIATEQSCGDGAGDVTTRFFEAVNYPTANDWALRVIESQSWVLTATEQGNLIYPRTLIVAADGSGDYTTVGAALAASAAEDRIQIKNGTYAPAYVSGSGYFVISKALTIEAYPGHAPVLGYSGTDKQNIIYITADNVILRGLKIVGTYALGDSSAQTSNNILIAGSATIDNCEIADFNHCGIKISNGRAIVKNCYVHHGGFNSQDHCIYYASHVRGTPKFLNNELTGSAGWGLHLYNYEYDAVITGNNIHDNTNGGLLLTGENHTVTGNTIASNGTGGGIRYYHSAVNLTVTNNTLSGNGTYDQLADFSAGEGFVNCTISGNSGTRNF